MYGVTMRCKLLAFCFTSELCQLVSALYLVLCLQKSQLPPYSCILMIVTTYIVLDLNLVCL